MGKTVSLEITNTPKSGQLIVKTDAGTGKALAGVKFEVKKANGEQVGIYTTDSSGRIYLTDIEAGKYVVVETSALDGYVLDSTAHEVNGLPAGTPLAGTIFEVYDYKTGNLVDRFVSGSDGRAVSASLPLGRYLVKEVRAPSYYKLSTQVLDIEIKFATQIIKQEFLNYSANIGVYIKKTATPRPCPVT